MPGAREMDERWAINLRDQCVNAQVPFFFKQHNKKGDRVLDGRQYNEYPGTEESATGGRI